MSDYFEKHNACGLKVGDCVTVIRTAENGEQGWNNTWDAEMDSSVGGFGEIIFDYGSMGFEVDLGERFMWAYPYFVLEKVED